MCARTRFMDVISMTEEKDNCSLVMVYFECNKIELYKGKQSYKLKCFNCSGPAASCQQCMF